MYLNLGGNSLAAVPESLATLKNMQTLHLFKNSITTLPEWLFCELLTTKMAVIRCLVPCLSSSSPSLPPLPDPPEPQREQPLLLPSLRSSADGPAAAESGWQRPAAPPSRAGLPEVLSGAAPGGEQAAEVRPLMP